MDIIAIAAEALAPISARGVSVKQGWYDENLKKAHVTLWNLMDSDEGYSDDEAELEEAYLQVNIWSTNDELSLKKEVKELLTKAGLSYQDGQDVEEKPGLFNKAMRFYMIREREE